MVVSDIFIFGNANFVQGCVEFCIFMGVRSAVPPSAALAAGATRAEGAEEASNLAGRDPPGTAPPGTAPPGTTSPDTTPVKTTIAIRQLPGESAKRTCIVTCLINLLLPLKPLQELSSSFSGA